MFITGMEEGLLPHSRSLDEQRLEEERRLCYVGMTRARDRLYLSHAHARTLHGGAGYRLPSRFLTEIPAEFTKHQAAGALRVGPSGSLSWVRHGSRRGSALSS